MKKIIVLLLCVALAICTVGCGSSSSSSSTSKSGSSETTTSSNKTSGAGNVLVVYFSATGNTKKLAKYASDYYGCSLYEIVPENEYTEEDLDYNNPDSRTTIEQNDKTARPAIQGQISMKKYDTIIIAYPIWWGQAPRIISTFLETYDFTGKTIVPFCTSGSSDIGDSANDLHELASGANWIDGKRFAADASETDVTTWLGEVCPK